VNSQAWTLFVTQWRIWLNFYRRHGRTSFVLSLLFSAVWYGGFAGIAVFAANFIADPANLDRLRRALPIALFFAFAYWQGMPLLMASVGGMLDFKKILVYPVAERDLFRIEMLLRTALFCEMPLVMLGILVGVLRNPALPKWCALGPVLFTVFNIALGAGLRDLIARWFQKKRVRELAMLAVVLLAALPSWLVSEHGPALKPLARWKEMPAFWLPWLSAAEASLAENGWVPWAALAAMTISAWAFSRWQFRKNLWFEAAAQRSADAATGTGLLDRVLAWPRWVFRDPLGALVEKEVRFLSRTSRFRIVFLMGFTFGVLIWIPMARLQASASPGWMGRNFLTVVVIYAMVLLSEVLFYNTFGFDRTAAQMYFLTPVRPALVLIAKNIAAAFFILAEVTLVTLACALLKMPVTPGRIAEAACVTLVMMLFLMAIGNLGSTRAPRAQNPTEGWKRASTSKLSYLSILLYPLIGAPIALAYLARYAFGTDLAFFAAIGAAIFIAGCFYYVSLESSSETLDSDREKFLTLLAQTDSPAI
jgi:ABC-2 type transport system permease protein